MSYDHWKTTNPDDEWLGSAQQSGDRDDESENDWSSDEEIGYWEHFGRYDEEPSDWRIDETSAEYQDRERNQ